MDAEALRQQLWLSHGCDALYGDDGEMQCGRCYIDFKRDTWEQIAKQFARALAERLATSRVGACDVCWTESWEPVETEAECALAHPHKTQREHVRCGQCWLRERLATAEADLAAERTRTHWHWHK